MTTRSASDVEACVKQIQLEKQRFDQFSVINGAESDKAFRSQIELIEPSSLDSHANLLKAERFDVIETTSPKNVTANKDKVTGYTIVHGLD